nr:ribonuclease H-like domain-containing protein [Tanacetum cinerariifolium]
TQLLIAQKKEARIQLQAKDFDLMVAIANLDEIEEVNANCILMANLQQASTSGTHTDTAPVYDLDGSAEVHNYDNCYDNEIFNMFTQKEKYTELLELIPEPHHVQQNDSNVISKVYSMEQDGRTVEQHPANVEETRTLYDSLYNNLLIEVEKVNTVNRKLRETNAELTTELARYKNQEKCIEISQEKYDKLERCYQKSVYQEQCLTKKINALHLSFGKQIMTLNEEISNLNKQLSMEKLTVSSLLEEKKKLKSDFKIRKDELLDKQIQLENKIKELDNILVKTGQSIQTMHMLSPKPDSFYHTEQKMALGYQNPFYLKSNTKNDRVPSASKSSCSKNKEVEVEEHPRNLSLSKNKNHMSSECNNVKLVIQNDKSEVVCAMCKQCLITTIHDVCVLNYVNDMNSRGKKQKENVSNTKNQMKQKPKVIKPKKVGSNERLASPKPSKPRSFLRWSPTGRLFDLKGKIIASSKSESQSDSSNDDNACTSNPMEPTIKRFLNSTSFIGRSKDEAPEVIKTFLKRITVLLYSPVIIIRTDNDTKFKNQVLKEYFDSVGISDQVSSVRTPQQNRVVERRNRTLVEAARTMLVFSRAPLFLCAESIATACYTQNRSIIHRRFKKTPYELINGKKRISPFYMYSELSVIPRMIVKILGSLVQKGDIGFFIGYSADSCAYRVYNRRTKKIMETMNVTFDELLTMAYSWKGYLVICSTNYSNRENQVVSKSFTVTTADASDKRQQQQDSTSSTSTLATTIAANGNFDFQNQRDLPMNTLLDRVEVLVMNGNLPESTSNSSTWSSVLADIIDKGILLELIKRELLKRVRFSIFSQSIAYAITDYEAKAKVTVIEEAKDLATLPLDELVENLKVYEMILENDSVVSKTTTKVKVKYLALKAKVTREQTSDNSDVQFGNMLERLEQNLTVVYRVERRFFLYFYVFIKACKYHGLRDSDSQDGNAEDVDKEKESELICWLGTFASSSARVIGSGATIDLVMVSISLEEAVEIALETKVVKA